MRQPVPSPRFATMELTTGLRVHYAEQGDRGGEAIVFLHGYAGSWLAFSRLLPLLPPRLHALAFDQRGHGESDRPDCCYAMEDFAADAVAFLDAAGLDRLTLVGHSLGSFAARRVAVSHPERVSRLVLIGSAVRPANEAVRALRNTIQGLADPVPADVVRALVESGTYYPVPEQFLEQLTAETLKVPSRVLQSALDGVLASDDEAELGRITTPTLLLSGEQHAFFGRPEQERLAAKIPDARLTVYAETGTSPHIERPERVAADLDAFLRAT